MRRGKMRQHVHIKQRGRGLGEAAMIESFVVLNAVGGECVDGAGCIFRLISGKGFALGSIHRCLTFVLLDSLIFSTIAWYVGLSFSVMRPCGDGS